VVRAAGHVVGGHVESESGHIRTGIQVPRCSQVAVAEVHVFEDVEVGHGVLPESVHNGAVLDAIVFVGEATAEVSGFVHTAKPGHTIYYTVSECGKEKCGKLVVYMAEFITKLSLAFFPSEVSIVKSQYGNATLGSMACSDSKIEYPCISFRSYCTN